MEGLGKVLVWISMHEWSWIPTWYVLVSIVTFCAYGVDKFAAKHDMWRVRERTLHLFELFGGWPGGLLAQKVVHHKCTKPEYQFDFKLMILLNLFVLTYFVYGQKTGDWSLMRVRSWFDSQVGPEIRPLS